MQNLRKNIVITFSLLSLSMLTSCGGLLATGVATLYSGVDYSDKPTLYIAKDQKEIQLTSNQETEIRYQIGNIFHAPNATVRVASHDPGVVKVISEKAGLIKGISPGKTKVSFFYVKKRIDVDVTVE